MSQSTAARLGFAALALAALLAAASIAGVRLGLLPYTQGWQLMIPATLLGAIAFCFSLVWLAKALAANKRSGRGPGLTALVGSLLLLYPPLSSFCHRLTSPPIHDFTTDTENPPRFVALAKLRAPGANAPAYDGQARVRTADVKLADFRFWLPGVHRGETVSLDEMLHDNYRAELKPNAGFAIGSKDPMATFFWRDFQAAKKTGWTIVDYSEKDGRIELSHASFWFGRISDIVIQARRAGAGARTDLRSQSRDDAIDDGANAANAKYFFSLLRR
ncbi:MAG: DUF1499 domain-containing protein [Alphaproteobacteria bacterium]|nr:DUF1499 domain-containing protein [Alphaproteobacteria bacterium]